MANIFGNSDKQKSIDKQKQSYLQNYNKKIIAYKCWYNSILKIQIVIFYYFHLIIKHGKWYKIINQ